MKRKALGRGLSALLSDQPVKPKRSQEPSPEAPAEVEGRRVLDIAVGDIQANQYQPRTEFDKTALDELAESIRVQGVLQPLLLRSLSDGKTPYELIAGERRLRASRQVGLETVPCIVIDAEEAQMLEIALIENIQRDDLNPLEEAVAYKNLSDRFGLTQEQIAEKVGKSRAGVANSLRLLNLPMSAKQALKRGDISMGHAKVLLGTSDKTLIDEMVGRIVESGWTVRQTENTMRLMGASTSGTKPSAKQDKPVDPNTQALKQAIERQLGSKVDITMRGESKGTLSLHFHNLDQLDFILERLGIRM